MSSLFQALKALVRLSSIASLLAAPAFAAGISATATYTTVVDPNTPGVYDYSLTLNNTGTTTIGTFWFAWVPGGDFLNPAPTNVAQPAGWVNRVLSTAQGTSIQWTTTSALLQPGGSLSGFNFSSTETPDQLLGLVPSGVGAGDPITTSFVYIGAPLRDPGEQFVATAATPEPGSLALLATGLLGGARASTVVQNEVLPLSEPQIGAPHRTRSGHGPGRVRNHLSFRSPIENQADSKASRAQRYARLSHVSFPLTHS